MCFYFSNQRLNNHSIFNLLYFLCCQTFNTALVNAFYECIHNVYRHVQVKLIINFCFLRVFSHFSSIWTANLLYRYVKLVSWIIQVHFKVILVCLFAKVVVQWLTSGLTQSQDLGDRTCTLLVWWLKCWPQC